MKFADRGKRKKERKMKKKQKWKKIWRHTEEEGNQMLTAGGNQK